ncbi:MAG TPA: hypothetical protein QGF58_02015 [Myxococcota bacterium]|nr:hypothetical protein [Myxococcota bacterium]
MIHLLTVLLAMVVVLVDGSPVTKALFVLPAVLWAPGVGFARRLSQSASKLQLHLDAAWISIVLAIPTLLMLRATGGGVAVLLGVSAIWAVLGTAWGWPHRRSESTRLRVRFGVLASVLMIVIWAMSARSQLLRPLEMWWHAEGLETLAEDAVPLHSGPGWTGATVIGWEELGTLRFEDADGHGGSLVIEEPGTIAVAVRGDVGDMMTIGGDSWTIESDPTVNVNEGPVPRYLDRGVVGTVLEVDAGELEIKLSGRGNQLYVMPSVHSPWELDGEDELKLVHYYQLLNIVENQRWSNEILASERNITVNQPPLWSWVLAVAVVGVDSDVIGANLLLLWVLVLLAGTGVRLLELVAPNAPIVAWLLPGAAAIAHGKLMLDPGSANFPDSLYAVAFVSGLVALKQPGHWRFAAIALLAGLLRYPGTIALSIAACLLWMVYRERVLKRLLVLWGLVAAVAATLAGLAIALGVFDEWLDILWFETVPEHFDNNQEADPIFERPPVFYWTWLRYTGFGLVLALPGLSRGARWVLGSALVYSLFLCTIDHFSSHYFLPLLALGAVAVGANAAPIKGPIIRTVVPLLAIAGFVGFVILGHA